MTTAEQELLLDMDGSKQKLALTKLTKETSNTSKKYLLSEASSLNTSLTLAKIDVLKLE